MPEWDELVDRHARLVFGVAYRITGSVHDAEDVAQDAFREAFEQTSRGRVTDWGGFLRRVAAFRAIDVVRRRRSEPLDPWQPSLRPGPVAECEARELAERVRRALGELPRQAATVFALTFFEQLPRAEVAAILSITPQAVSVALFHARRRLEEILFHKPSIDESICHERES
jgi:RNA polymerase sigma-70 factor (ECF subfamily)